MQSFEAIARSAGYKLVSSPTFPGVPLRSTPGSMLPPGPQAEGELISLTTALPTQMATRKMGGACFS